MNAPYYRWSDNDRRAGRFIYAYSGRERGFRLGLMLSSRGDDDEGRFATLRAEIGRHTLIVILPPIIEPHREYVALNEKYQRVPREQATRGYWDGHQREFGFTISDGALHYHYGEQTHEWPGTKSGCWFFPWRSWRNIRHSLYDLQGQHFADLPAWRGLHGYEARKALENACPAAQFSFRDFDGEQITCTTRVEERESARGEGRWKWLSWFSRKLVRRSLNIEFHKETGRRKGSWKGGTVGHSIEMRPAELHEPAFRRYCEQNEMTFGAPAAEQVPA